MATYTMGLKTAGTTIAKTFITSYGPKSRSKVRRYGRKRVRTTRRTKRAR